MIGKVMILPVTFSSCPLLAHDLKGNLPSLQGDTTKRDSQGSKILAADQVIAYHVEATEHSNRNSKLDKLHALLSCFATSLESMWFAPILEQDNLNFDDGYGNC